MTIAITLAPRPGICSRWLSDRVSQECVVAMCVLRVVLFAMLLLLLVCLFSRVVEYILL